MLGSKLASVLLLGLSCIAVAPAAAQEDTRCYTALGKANVAVTTRWSTLAASCTRTKTSTKMVTTTPKATTKFTTTTIVSTSIGPTTTFTATATTTTTRTTTSVSTVTFTFTVTSTSVTTVRSTVSPSGFLPIQTTLPEASCDANCGIIPVQKRELDGRAAGVLSLFGLDGQVPQRVDCYKWSENAVAACTTITKTVTSTATAAKPTRTVTKTTQSITTVYPSATTTTNVYVTTTSTVFSVSQTSTTSTTIVVSSTSTKVYAACATNNFADLYQGMPLNNGNPQGEDATTFNATMTNATSAYDCCVASVQSPRKNVAFGYVNGTCVTAYQGTCTAKQNSVLFYPVSGDATEPQAVFGNLQCGKFVPNPSPSPSA